MRDSGAVGRVGRVAQGGGGQGLGESGANQKDKSRLEKVHGNIATVPYGRGGVEGKGKKGEEKEKKGDPRTGVKRTWVGGIYRGGAKKPFLAPSFPNLGVNKNAYNYYGFFGDKIAQTKNDFTAETHSKFSDDSRINHISHKIPVINEERGGGGGLGHCFKDPGVSATATAWTSGCNTCNLEGGNHGVQSKGRIFFFGDSATPPLVGVNSDCAPTFRVESGNFCQLKEMLEKVNCTKNNFFAKGSFGVISLMSHLSREGINGFVEELEDFVDYAEKKHGLTILPCLMPFSSSMDDASKISISQFWQYMLHKGNGGDHRFILWEAFKKTLEKFEMKTSSLPLLPFSVKEDGLRAKLGGQKGGVLHGFEGDFSGGIPPKIEEFFLNETMATIRGYCEVYTVNTELVIPSPFSVLKGISLKAGTMVSPGKGFSKEDVGYVEEKMKELAGGGKKLILLGSSILKNALQGIKKSRKKQRN